MHRVNGSSELILVGELHFVSRCMTKARRAAFRARKDFAGGGGGGARLQPYSRLFGISC